MFKHPWRVKNVKTSLTEKITVGLFIVCGLFWGSIAGIRCFGEEGWHNTIYLVFVAPFGVITLYAIGNMVITDGKSGKQQLAIAIANALFIVTWLVLLVT